MVRPMQKSWELSQTTPEILSTLNPFVAIPLTSEKRITLFPFPDILKPVPGFFFRGYSCHKLFFGGFTLPQQIPF